MRFLAQTFRIQTANGPYFVDITDKVQEAAGQAAIQNGFAVIFSKHTTAAIRINENEPALIRDMEELLKRIAPPGASYRHNDFAHRICHDGERPNGHAHCQQLLLGASEAIPIVNGQLLFGPWQRIFLVELDQAREREVVIQLVGE